jgi:hypothetical protein
VLNCSKEPRQVEDLLDPAYGFLQVSLSPRGGKRVPYRPAVRRDARGKRPRTLSPGERLSAWVPVYAGADGWMLREPAEYQVHAEHEVEGARVSATAVAFVVEAPEGPDERAAAELMMDSAAAQLLLTGRDQGERGSSRLATLLREHPKSPLAPYAQLAFATARLQARFDPAIKDFRTPDCKGAVELLRPAVARIRDPFLAAIGTRSFADCLRTLGRHAEAEEAFRVYAQSHPGGLELPGVREALEANQRPTAR